MIFSETFHRTRKRKLFVTVSVVSCVLLMLHIFYCTSSQQFYTINRTSQSAGCSIKLLPNFFSINELFISGHEFSNFWSHSYNIKAVCFKFNYNPTLYCCKNGIKLHRARNLFQVRSKTI